METRENCRRVTRQVTKNLPALPIAKRRKLVNTSYQKKAVSRSKKLNNNETAEPACSVDLKQVLWTGGYSLSDDEELPSAVVSSPAKNSQKPTYKKHDIVWIKYRTEPYRPCLITSVKKDQVRFKFIYGKRSDTYRTRLGKVIGFDDPDKNIELLNRGREINSHVVDAYERARLYFCRLSEKKDLSPLKFLFFDKTEDLLYGMVPDHEIEKKDCVGEEQKEYKMEENEFDGPVTSNDEDSDTDMEENKEDEPCGDIYQRMTVEEKSELLENLKILLEAVASEDCFRHLKQIVEGSIKSIRMKLFKEERELDLQMKSGGLGPFYGAEVSETDKLFHIIDEYTEKMQFQGDSSLLARHVLIPEAIIFALQKEWKWSHSKADEFLMKWTVGIPTWSPKESENQNDPT